MLDKKDLYNDLTCNSSVALHLIIVSYNVVVTVIASCSINCTLMFIIKALLNSEPFNYLY